MRSQLTTALLAGLSIGAIAQTQIGQTCIGGGVCYKLNIPEATAKNGGSDIFLSLSGPTTNTWIGLGIGSSMLSADMFIMYTNGNGNVTLSPRHSRAEVQPRFDNSLDVELLGGSGVENGVMTANVRCGNCTRSADGNFGGQSGQWVHAQLSGSPMDTTDVQATITQHDIHDSFTWTYSDAVGGASTNPFTASNATVVSGSAKTNSNGNLTKRQNMLLVHGVFASLAFLVFFPVGGIVIRIGGFNNVLMVHMAIQIFSWLLFITAFGIGVYWANNLEKLSESHCVIGIILFVMLVFQPLSGWLHHRQFVRSGQRKAISHSHLWSGRVAIILGMINGGLGLKLASIEKRYVVAYSVVAGVMGLAYIGSVVYGEIARSRRTSAAGNGHEKMESAQELSAMSG